jgi:O-antigen/teichoic acid export membrane protein
MKFDQISPVPAEIDSPDLQPAPGLVQSQDVLTAAKGGGISFVGRLFEYIVRFAFSIIVARAIGVEQFGLYTLGTTVVSIAAMLALLGFQTGIVRFMPPAIRKRDDARIWGIIQIATGLPAISGLILATGLFLFAYPLANMVFHDNRLVFVFRLACLGIPLEALNWIAFTIVQSFKKMQYIALANNIVIPVSKLFFSIAFLAAGLSTSGIVAAHVIATAAGLALLIYFVNKLFKLNRPFRSAKRDLDQLLKYSLTTHLGWMLLTVRGTLETLILGFLGLTTGVGVFTAATRLSTIGNMLFVSIASISGPIITDLYSRGEFIQLKAFYRTTTRWLVTFNLPLFLTFMIFAGPLLSIFGSDFTTGATSLMILAIGMLVYTGTGVGATILDMTDHPKVNSANSAFLVLVSISFDVLFIPRWGVIGAAAASALATVLVNIIALVEVYILVGMQPYDLRIVKPFLAGLVTTILTYLITQRLTFTPLVQMLVGVVLLWGIYAGTLLILGFTREDILVMDRLRSRIKLPILFGGNAAH